jgi:peptidoglycan/xylan/chitin deacetylase (PgdA/CDA1 family)
MTAPWVCVMYHQVLASAPSTGAAEYFAVSRETFGRHLDAIRAAGYRGCSLAEAVHGDAAALVAITFDDGTVGHATQAVPELVARGMTATFFVTTSWVGQPGYLTWEQLHDMRQVGMEIGSHTRTHPFLSELSEAEVERELRGSREEIDARLGQRTVALALPGGDPPRRARRGLVARAGYQVVATSRWGRNRSLTGEPPYWVRRSTIRRTTGDAEFRRVLHGDPLLALRHTAREALLGSARHALGPSRYARWRRRVLGLARPVGA